MRKFIFFTLFIILTTLSFHSSAQAQDPDDEAGLCRDILTSMEQGTDEGDVVSSYILVGHSPCFVIKCAVEGEGDLWNIIEGALNAGVTPDIVSRCALLGGAESEAVAEALNELSPPDGQTPGPYNEAPLEKPHAPLSPSEF